MEVRSWGWNFDPRSERCGISSRRAAADLAAADLAAAAVAVSRVPIPTENGSRVECRLHWWKQPCALPAARHVRRRGTQRLFAPGLRARWKRPGSSSMASRATAGPASSRADPDPFAGPAEAGRSGARGSCLSWPRQEAAESHERPGVREMAMAVSRPWSMHAGAKLPLPTPSLTRKRYLLAAAAASSAGCTGEGEGPKLGFSQQERHMGKEAQASYRHLEGRVRPAATVPKLAPETIRAVAIPILGGCKAEWTCAPNGCAKRPWRRQRWAC